MMQNEGYQFGYPQETNAQDERVWRLVLWAIVLLVSAWGLYTIASAIITRQNTGLLQVDAFSDNATITVKQSSSKIATVGKGDVTVRLKPGEYQVIATDGETASGRTATVVKQQTVAVDIGSQKPLEVEKVADYPGQNMHVSSDNTLFFLNTAESLLYSYKLGGAEARPYYTTINTLVRAHWLRPAELFVENSGREWQYVKDGQATSIPLPSQEEGRQPPAVDTFSFDKSGAFAYTADDKIVLFAPSAEATLQKIATTKTTATRTAVGPDGKVLLFTPADAAISDTTKLYSNGKITELPEQLSGMVAASWSPDGSRIVYTTEDGLFTYDLSSKAVVQVLNDKPTNPYGTLWLTNTMLIYAQGQVIWKYDVSEQLSIKVTSFEGTLDAKEPFDIAADNLTVYFGTAEDSDGKGGNIYRFVPRFNDLTAQEQKTVQESLKKTAAPSKFLTFINNLEELLDEGLATDQLSNLRYALSEYVTAKAPDTEIVSIDAIDFLAPEPGNIKNKIEFTVLLNEEPKLKARIEYWNLIALRLYLYDDSDTLVYDSGDITTQQ